MQRHLMGGGGREGRDTDGWDRTLQTSGLCSLDPVCHYKPNSEQLVTLPHVGSW